MVAKSVPANAIVTGNHAGIIGYVENSIDKNLASSMNIVDHLTNESGMKKIGIGEVSKHRINRFNGMRGDFTFGKFLKEIPFEPNAIFLFLCPQ